MPKQRTAGHGSATLYVYGCRCAECVTAKSRRDAEYRASRRAEIEGGGVPGRVRSVQPAQVVGEVPMTNVERKAALERMLAKQPAHGLYSGEFKREWPADSDVERVPVGEE